MKLIGGLKKQVESAADISVKRSLIEKAGMALTDDELDMVAGGDGAIGINEETGEYQIWCNACQAYVEPRYDDDSGVPICPFHKIPLTEYLNP